MNEQELKEIEDRCNAATKWTADDLVAADDYYIAVPHGERFPSNQPYIVCEIVKDGDAAFIASAQTDVLKLLQEIKTLKVEGGTIIADLRQAIKDMKDSSCNCLRNYAYHEDECAVNK